MLTTLENFIMVSIIIPCYNVAPCIIKTITSILTQTDSDWEMIAVDDGSTDQTEEILKKYSEKDNRIKLIAKSNGGVSSARNTGLMHARGEWIYFLDGDDLIEETLVETINNQSSETEVVVFEFVIESKNKTRHCKIAKASRLFKNYLINKQTIHISSMAVQRNFIVRYNIYFDEDTYYGEDGEYIAKIFSLNPNYVCVNKFLFRYQIRDGSAMTSRVYNERRFSSVLASERTYKNLIGTPEESKALAVLGFTIARHLKMYYEFLDKDENLEYELIKYCHRYLKGWHYYGVGHIEIYTSIAGILSYNQSILRLFLKIL